MDYNEVAAMTDSALGTVKSRIHRGRLRLRADGRAPGTLHRMKASGPMSMLIPNPPRRRAPLGAGLARHRCNRRRHADRARLLLHPMHRARDGARCDSPCPGRPSGLPAVSAAPARSARGGRPRRRSPGRLGTTLLRPPSSPRGPRSCWSGSSARRPPFSGMAQSGAAPQEVQPSRARPRPSETAASRAAAPGRRKRIRRPVTPAPRGQGFGPGGEGLGAPSRRAPKHRLKCSVLVGRRRGCV